MVTAVIARIPYKRIVITAVVLSGMAFSVLQIAHVGGAQLLQRSVKLSDNQVGRTAAYQFSFRPQTADALQTIAFEFCSNSALQDDVCDPVPGLDLSDAELSEEQGDLGFAVSPSLSNSNTLVITRAPFSSLAQQNTYTFTGIRNPSAMTAYFVRIQTFSQPDISGVPTHFGGVVFAIKYGIDVTAVVPPYLMFCVGVTVNGFDCNDVVGDFVNFGEFSSRQASIGSTQMLVASNARDGHTVRVNGPTLTSGINIIPNLTGSDISRPGVSQFGMNLRANSAPAGGNDATGSGTGSPTNGYNQINNYRYNPGDVVAVSTGPDRARKYTSTYVVNVARSQPPGAYVSTLSYIALGSY